MILYNTHTFYLRTLRTYTYDYHNFRMNTLNLFCYQHRKQLQQQQQQQQQNKGKKLFLATFTSSLKTMISLFCLVFTLQSLTFTNAFLQQTSTFSLLSRPNEFLFRVSTTDIAIKSSSIYLKSRFKEARSIYTPPKQGSFDRLSKDYRLKMVNVEALGLDRNKNFDTDLSYFDTARIYVRAGSGGAGSKHFKSHSKAANNHQKTVPDGGSGGKGGDVILICNRAINTLQNFRGKKTFAAENGKDGDGQYQTGRKGKNEEVFVPPGTMVYLEEEIEENDDIDIDFDSDGEDSDYFGQGELIDFDVISEEYIQNMKTKNSNSNKGYENNNSNFHQEKDIQIEHNEQKSSTSNPKRQEDSDSNNRREKGNNVKGKKLKTKKTFLYELKEDGDTWIAAYGGEGGIGNGAVKGNTGKSCPPKGGDRRWLTLELRLVADVGLVAVPSAGKSTLLSKISNAKPKIAAYHFTTLVPNLGVCEKYLISSYDTLSQSKMERSLIVADIPGLIEGAHRGLGLGKAFLKHVEKCRVIVHLIDGNSGLETVLKNFDVINTELSLFSKELTGKPQVVIINKTDTLTQEELEEMKKHLQLKMSHTRLLSISALTGEGINEMMQRLVAFIKKIDEYNTNA